MISSKFNSKNNYRPKKILTGVAQSSEGIASWLYNDLENDPWWQGSNAVPYKFIITFTITPIIHGSHLTREPYSYNGLDIVPNMWVSAMSEAKALKITKIISKTAYSITCECEDEYRYNIFKDNSGNGNACFTVPSPVIFFELGDDGIPVFDPIPPEATDLSILGQLESRFRVFNITKKLKLFKQNHDFVESDVITIINGEYTVLRNMDDIKIGIVSDIGPSPNEFWIIPSEQISELEPGVYGTIGSMLWFDGDKLTTSQQAINPSYIKIKSEIPCVTEYTNNSYIGTFKLNGATIHCAGDILASINTSTDKHGCIAVLGKSTETIISTNIFPKTKSNRLQFKLNNATIDIIPPSITYGASGYIGVWDIVRSINELTAYHGCIAKVNNNGEFELTYTENLAIQNITPLVSDGEQLTFMDMFEFNTVYQSTTDIYKVIRDDGGDIIFTEIDGNSELHSASNGRLCTIMSLNMAPKTSSIYIVEDIGERNSMINLKPGDQTYVKNTGVGEWGLFIKTANGWVKISDQNSANTDANTFTIDIDSTEPATIIGNMSEGSKISNITCIVTEAFDSTADLKIGTSIGLSDICDGSIFDFTKIGRYTEDSTFVVTENYDINVWVQMTNSSKGKCKIYISYL